MIRTKDESASGMRHRPATDRCSICSAAGPISVFRTRRTPGRRRSVLWLCRLVLAAAWIAPVPAADFERLPYNHPGLIVDLGVGLWVWPLPMDYDGDGDPDLLAACPDRPSNGVWYFENPGTSDKFPVFRPAVRLGDARRYMHLSWVDGTPRILVLGAEYPDFRNRGFRETVPVGPSAPIHPGSRIRAQNWNYVDYDGNGAFDLIVGIGDWSEYGWDNAFDAHGVWRNGRLHGYVYLLKNRGSTARPRYDDPVRIQAGGADIDVYGWPGPAFADFDQDGDLDLVCGEFLDTLTYFENSGSREQPDYRKGRRLTYRGQVLRMPLPMIVPVAFDWDSDGDMDLIVGQEDGRIALVEHTGRVVSGVPEFLPPRFFQQEADCVKFGVDATPAAADWDGDGDTDILCGNSAGQIGFIENLGGTPLPKWAAPKLLHADGRCIQITAGNNGSIQGPAEARWGQTVLSVEDWDGDDLPDLLVNSMRGEILWYRNVGTRRRPKLAAAVPVEVAWPGKPPKPRWNWWDPSGSQLVTQWRTTPVAVDLTSDGLTDLVVLDHEGYLTLFERRRVDGRLQLLPGDRRFIDETGRPIRLNPGTAGKSGRRKIHITDWDGDGRPDLLVDSINVDLWRHAGMQGRRIVLQKVGPLGQRPLAKHSTAPATVDWDGNGRPDLLVGAEDGFFYYLPHEAARQISGVPRHDAENARQRAAVIANRSRIIVQEETLFADSHMAEIRGLSAADTSAGLVVVACAVRPEFGPQPAVWISRHRGEWSETAEVTRGIQYNGQPVACSDPVLVQIPQGPLKLFCTMTDSSRSWTELLTSWDGGRVWQERRKLPTGVPGPRSCRVLVRDDGTCEFPAFAERQGVLRKLSMKPDETFWRRSVHVHGSPGLCSEFLSMLSGVSGTLVFCRSRSGQLCVGRLSPEADRMTVQAASVSGGPILNGDILSLHDGRILMAAVQPDRRSAASEGNLRLHLAVRSDGSAWRTCPDLHFPAAPGVSPVLVQDHRRHVHLLFCSDRQTVRHVRVQPDELPSEGTARSPENEKS